MKQFLARIAYWKSLGFDPSEMPEAAFKEYERLERLKRRLGDKDFKHWKEKYYHKQTDPAFVVGMLPYPLAVIGVVLFLAIVRP